MAKKLTVLVCWPMKDDPEATAELSHAVERELTMRTYQAWIPNYVMHGKKDKKGNLAMLGYMKNFHKNHTTEELFCTVMKGIDGWLEDTVNFPLVVCIEVALMHRLKTEIKKRKEDYPINFILSSQRRFPEIPGSVRMVTIAQVVGMERLFIHLGSDVTSKELVAGLISPDT